MGDTKPICGICAKAVDNIVLMCKYCFRGYHPACKKVFAGNVKKCLNQYLCSDVCQANYDRIVGQQRDEVGGDTGAAGDESENSTVKQLKMFMSLKFNELQIALDTALTENKELNKKFDVLSKKCVMLEKTVENLKYDADGGNRIAVRNNITIQGVPAQIAADPNAAFAKLCDVISYHVAAPDVNCIKMFKNKVTRATTILVEFSNYKAKRDFLAKKKAKGDVTVAEVTGGAAAGSRLIFIRDDLTKRGIALYAELRAVRKLVKIKYCWTRDGDVFARIDDGSRFICVKSSFDIQDLANIAERINQAGDDDDAA
jgi:hypothetical protein